MMKQCIDMMNSGMMGGMIGSGMMGGMALLGGVLLVLFALGAIWLIRAANGGVSASPALRLLDKRLACGEIDKEDYQQRRHLLQH